MKRQMKMTTSKEPQKKFLGGAMKKMLGKVASAVKSSTKAPQADKAKPMGALGVGLTGAKIASDAAKSASSAGKGARVARGMANLVRSLVKKKKPSGGAGVASGLAGVASSARGMKKGGAVMTDKMGRAMKKTTADAKGRAMRKGK
jgi:hypothetical protein